MEELLAQCICINCTGKNLMKMKVDPRVILLCILNATFSSNSNLNIKHVSSNSNLNIKHGLKMINLGF